MDFHLLIKHIDVVLREAWNSKFLCLTGFALISFVVLVIGMFWSSKFETSATIFADNQNILKPLLSNQAAQSSVQNTTKVVKDTMMSPRILKEVVEQVYGLDSFESADELGQKINNLRNKIEIKGLGANYIKVSYSDATADDAYNVINAIIDRFIKASSEEQRSESREAFLFIDNQVKQYKDQLVSAENKLKEFRAFNFDGRDGDVDASISRLREQIEELKINIDEDNTAIKDLEKQLANESQFSAKKFKKSVYTERLEKLEANKATLLLTYTEDYPDVVSLQFQIDDIKKAIAESEEENGGASDDISEDAVANPIYLELRSRLSQVSTEVKAKQKRLIALNRLMEQEFERRKRIAERAAEEAELTRDYTVTRKIYEDMLERKEKARLSMTLNVEGQGVTYRVQEPALPPLNPVGLTFFHFVLMGPIVGVVVVLCLLVLFVLLDPRIRFPERLHELEVRTLAVVPHVNTRFTKRIVKIDMVLCFFFGLMILAAYVGLAYASRAGLI